MKKVLIILLAAILPFASAAYSAQKIEDIPWDESHIKQLRAGKHAVFRFLLRQEDPNNEMEWTESSLHWNYNWYPAGDGKYELAIGYSSGPDIGYFTVFWHDAPGKIRSQDFDSGGDASEKWYDGPFAADLNGDGREELIQFDSLEYHPPPERTKFIPSGTWPRVYRLRDGKYVEASRDFPTFYENKILPKLDEAIAKARKDLPALAGKAPVRSSPYDNSWEMPARYLAALIMCRDKILRVIGRDPMAGLAQAREWMNSPDPVMVDNAKAVFEDIVGARRRGAWGGGRNGARIEKLAQQELVERGFSNPHQNVPSSGRGSELASATRRRASWKAVPHPALKRSRRPLPITGEARKEPGFFASL